MATLSLMQLSHFFGDLDRGQVSGDLVILALDIPLTVRFFSESVTLLPPFPLAIWTETEETEDASESHPLEMPPSKLEAVELLLFFFGNGGRTFPGNSVLNAL